MHLAFIRAVPLASDSYKWGVQAYAFDSQDCFVAWDWNTRNERLEDK